MQQNSSSILKQLKYSFLGLEAMSEGSILEIGTLEDAQAKTLTIDVRDSGIGLGLVVVKNLT